MYLFNIDMKSVVFFIFSTFCLLVLNYDSVTSFNVYGVPFDLTVSFENANYSFGYSLSPVVKSNGKLSLIVGAPQTRNSLPSSSFSLGGFYECDMTSSICGINRINSLNSEMWSLFNLGMTVASSYNPLQPVKDQLSSTFLVCDPRAIVASKRSSQNVLGVGVCYLIKSDDFEAYGSYTFLPKIFTTSTESVAPMNFGISATPIKNSHSYSIGIPYFLDGFGGTFFSSQFDQSQLRSGRLNPFVYWGHSYIGGLDLIFNSMEASYESKILPDVTRSLEDMKKAINSHKIDNYGCNGFSTDNGNIYNFDQSTMITLVEGAPCVPDNNLKLNIFDHTFANEYQANMRKPDILASVGYGTVHIYTIVKLTAPYCLIEGKFNGEIEKMDPQTCFEKKSALRATLHGKSFGSRFGHQVLLLDLNKDGVDDLIVTAPFYSDSNDKRTFDQYRFLGAVYVYMNKGYSDYIRDNANPTFVFYPPVCEGTFISDQVQQLCNHSKTDEAWFGWSLAALGDVNQDGYPDFAVGSPFSQIGGAVFIYLGGVKEVLLGQIILNLKVQGFAEALGSGADFNGNGYPDLTVGAPRSGIGHVFLYPTRPVVKLEIKSVATTPNIISASASGLSSCTNPDLNKSNKNSCIKFTIQVLHNLQKPVSLGDKVTFRIKLVVFLDEEFSGKRFKLTRNSLSEDAYFITESSPTDLTIEAMYEENASNQERDINNPLLLKVLWQFETMAPFLGSAPSAVKMLNYPYLIGDPIAESQKRTLTRVVWDHGCKSEVCFSEVTVRCISNLNRDEILVGGSESTDLKFTCFIRVKEDPAYRTYLLISYRAAAFTLESGKDFDKDRLKNTDESSDDYAVMKYFLANPISSGSEMSLSIFFKPSSISPDLRYADFNFTATTSSILSNRSIVSSVHNLTVKTLVSVNLDARFTSSIQYDNSTVLGFNGFAKQLYKLSSQFPRLAISLANQASAYLPTSYLIIHWPYETLGELNSDHGKYLLYMVTPPQIMNSSSEAKATDIVCSSDDVNALLNPLKLSPNSFSEIDKNRRGTPVRLVKDPLLPPHAIPNPVSSNFSNVASSCDKTRRFNFTYSCANSRCKPVVCRLGELSSRTQPLQLEFITVGYKYTFSEDNYYCRSVSIVPSVQWIPAPEYQGRVLATYKQESNTPVLFAYNAHTPPQEEMPLIMKIVIYGGAVLAGLLILGIFILILRLCTPFFRRQSTKPPSKGHQPPNDDYTRLAPALSPGRYLYDEDDADDSYYR